MMQTSKFKKNGSLCIETICPCSAAFANPMECDTDSTLISEWIWMVQCNADCWDWKMGRISTVKSGMSLII